MSANRQVSLARRGSPLANPARQCELLEQSTHRPFANTLAECGHWPLRPGELQILQVNVGKLCNQTCRHCHVDAGPDRREIMSRETMALCLNVLQRTGIAILDVTGGAPELNPHFRWLVSEGRALGKRVIDRCNLTILLSPGYEDLPEFLAQQQVEVIASLPCYLQKNTDRQRGDGVFEKSIEALRRLNSQGYGQPGGPLLLTLVYNPVGPSLPPNQEPLEAAYRHELKSRHGIVFSRLFTITNLPISRFLEDLLESEQYDSYMEKLVNAFNPQAVAGLMCRNTLSVGWDGRLFDCDFNQMLDLQLAGRPRHIKDFDDALLARRTILTGQHCYGCTAGSGSGCQGSIVAS
jgi:radical SAM/Cys-rich protein